MMVVLISSTLPDEPELDPKIAILLSLFAFFSFLFSFFFPGNGVDSMRCMGDDVKIRVEAEEGSVAQSPRTSHSQVVDTWTWSQHPRPSSSLKSPDTSCSVVVVWSLLSLVVLLDLIWESTVSCRFVFLPLVAYRTTKSTSCTAGYLRPPRIVYCCIEICSGLAIALRFALRTTTRNAPPTALVPTWSRGPGHYPDGQCL